MDVNPIGDELCVNPVVAQCRPQRTRPPVVQAGHRIVRVRGLRNAGFYRRSRLLECRRRVPQDHPYARRCRHTNQGIRPRHFRSQRDHAHRTCTQERFKLRRRRRPDVRWVLRPGKLRAQKRPFQMHSQHPRPDGRLPAVSRPRRFNITGRVLDRRQRSRS